MPFEATMNENFPKLISGMKGMKPQIQEAQRTSRRINAKKPIPRHIFKLKKKKNQDEEKNLERSQGGKGKDKTCIRLLHRNHQHKKSGVKYLQS